MKIIENSIVKSIAEVAKNTIILTLESPKIASHCQPGQFVNIQIPKNLGKIWRRPFSSIRKNEREIEILLKIVGDGTRAIASVSEGDVLSLIGPLGNGFSRDNERFPILLGGGVGIAPMLDLERFWNSSHREYHHFAGFCRKDDVFLKPSEYRTICTDDGSVGKHGNVLDVFLAIRNQFPKRIKLYACGPILMLRAVEEFSVKNNIPCEISIETVMGCGIGLCQGCAIQTQDEKKTKLVCKDGPIFNNGEIKL